MMFVFSLFVQVNFRHLCFIARDCYNLPARTTVPFKYSSRCQSRLGGECGFSNVASCVSSWSWMFDQHGTLSFQVLHVLQKMGEVSNTNECLWKSILGSFVSLCRLYWYRWGMEIWCQAVHGAWVWFEFDCGMIILSAWCRFPKLIVLHDVCIMLLLMKGFNVLVKYMMLFDMDHSCTCWGIVIHLFWGLTQHWCDDNDVYCETIWYT